MVRRLLSFSVLLFSLSVLAALAGVAPERAPRAMVVSVHPEASRVGVDVMRAGGNAVDAAVATGFSLAVVHPAAGNLGGGGFLLLRFRNGETHFVDFREMAPAKATANMYQDANGKVIEGLSLYGYKAIGVPGSVAGLAYAQKKWGKLTLKQVMAPAIKLARDGFALTFRDAEQLQDSELAKFPESRRIFQRDGNFYKQGEVFKQPVLARTLERIAADPADFYKGQLARELAVALQKGGALITAEDLAKYEVKERAPVRGTYRGYDVISAPPPSSGGVALIEALNILEGYRMGDLGSRSAESIHLTAEAFRRVFDDRAEFMGDPDFAHLPVAQLLDKRYAAKWRESLNPDKASVSAELRRPGFGAMDVTASLRQAATAPEPQNTTHYSVVDPQGNAVAVTTTLNDSFGSRVTAEGLGFLLNNEMDDFSSAPGVPNAYGLVQGPANAIAGGKRPLSAMTPTFVLNNDKLFLVLGSPGGPTIITTVANVLMGVVDYGLNLQEAVNAPRFHHQWLPDQLTIENMGLSPDTIRLIEQKGHKIDRQNYYGDAECIAIDPKTGERLGAADFRNGGAAVGF
jgi:gamma-glutamyltranspeptidase / glutathione hydrolase